MILGTAAAVVLLTMPSGDTWRPLPTETDRKLQTEASALLLVGFLYLR